MQSRCVEEAEVEEHVPALFHLPLLLSLASSVLGCTSGLVFLASSYLMWPSPDILCKAAGRPQHKLLLFLCTEFSFPGPDDCSWSKYEEALAESHDGSEEEEEEEGMEVPCTCELEVQSFTEHCTERETQVDSGSWHMLGIARGEILPSPQSLPGLPQGSLWELDSSRGRWIAHVQKLWYTSSRL